MIWNYRVVEKNGNLEICKIFYSFYKSETDFQIYKIEDFKIDGKDIQSLKNHIRYVRLAVTKPVIKF